MGTRRPPGIRVLVVDDDSSLCQLLGEVLRAEGYQPIICTHPRDALAVSEQETFGLTFLDLKLPEMSGLELASTPKHQNPLREVVFVAGYGTFDYAVEGVKVGTSDNLRKPSSIDDLNLCLKRFQEHQELKEKVRTAEKRYFGLVQKLPLLVYVIRRDFQLEFVNQTCTTMLGYTPEEVKNVPNWFLEWIYSEDRERIRKSFDLPSILVDPLSLQNAVSSTKKGHLIHSIVKSINSSRCETNHTVDPLEGIIVNISYREEMAQAIEAALAENAYSCLYKPFQMEELLQLLTEIHHRELGRVLGQPVRKRK